MPDAIKVTEHQCWVMYEGERPALIEAGVLRPGDKIPGSRRSSFRLSSGHSISRRASGILRVRVHREAHATPSESDDFRARDVRAELRAMFDCARAEVLAAFNLAGCRDWQFPQSVQVRAEELIQDLSSLFWENEASITLTKSALAQSDGNFQRFMQTVIAVSPLGSVSHD